MIQEQLPCELLLKQKNGRHITILASQWVSGDLALVVNNETGIPDAQTR